MIDENIVIGQTVGSWVMLLPLLDATWLAADTFGTIASVVPHVGEDYCEIKFVISDVIYFLSENNKLEKLCRRIKKTIEWKDFVDICKGCVKFNRCGGIWTANWKNTEKEYWIAYGRLMEIVPHPNWQNNL